MTGLIRILCPVDKLEKQTQISLSIRLASEIIILLTSYQSFACNACQCCRSKIYVASPASRYGFIMVYFIIISATVDQIES